MINDDQNNNSTENNSGNGSEEIRAGKKKIYVQNDNKKALEKADNFESKIIPERKSFEQDGDLTKSDEKSARLKREDKRSYGVEDYHDAIKAAAWSNETYQNMKEIEDLGSRRELKGKVDEMKKAKEIKSIKEEKREETDITPPNNFRESLKLKKKTSHAIGN